MASPLLVTVATLLAIVTDGQRQMKTCSDYYECQNKPIASNLVDCSGYGACDSSTITSKGKMGYIDCTGSHACNEAKKLSAYKEIHCLGHYSCFASGQISCVKTIQCAGSYSCKSSSSITADANMYCGGFEACKASTITCGKTIYCDGLNSCNGGTMTAETEILCEGTKSCIGAKLDATTKVECSGNAACKRARIKAEKVVITGFGAGQGAKINSEDIEATGYDALSTAEMDSQNKTNMRVKTSGEAAGDSATVICRDGSQCQVECTDACEKLEVVSMAGASTTTSVAGETCTESGNVTGCPMVKVSTSDCEDREIETYLAHKREIIAARLIGDIDTGNKAFIERIRHHDAMEDIEPEIKKCYKNTECKQQSIYDDDAQCYGYKGCAGAAINQSSTSGMIGCFGDSACDGGFLNTRGDILCNGENGCGNAVYFEGKSVQCGGYESCARITDTADVGSMDCEGTGSCRENTITAKTNIKCLANRACYLSDITTGNTILCEGHYSCSQSNLVATTGAIKCNAMFACFEATVSSNKYVYADGDQAAAKSNISTPAIRAYGQKAFAYATIDTDGDKLTVKAYGDLSGTGATVICRAGVTCKVTCMSNACKSMDYICYDGAVCGVVPKECGRERGPKAVDGIFCPTMKTSIDKKGDKRLDEYIVKRKREHKTEKLYAEIMNKIDRLSENEERILYDTYRVNDIEMKDAEDMNGGDNDEWNGKLISISWDIIIFGVIVIMSVGLICYFRCDFRFRGHNIADYQYLK